MYKLIALLFLTSTIATAKTIRKEVDRYRLLHDREYTERYLLKDKHDSFFAFDFSLSSGLKKLIGDINSATAGTNEASQAVATTKVLSQNVNTEKYANINFEVAAPLPYFSLGRFRFLTAAFYQVDIGFSLSMNNELEALNPTSQVYIQKVISYGLFSRIKDNNKEDLSYSFAFYKKAISDTSISQTGLDVATNDKLYNVDDLKNAEKFYALDLGIHKNKKDFDYLVEVISLNVLDAGGEAIAKIGTSPLVHARYSKYYTFENFTLKPFFGLHYSRSYNILDMMYFGTKLRPVGNPLINFIFKIDGQFISYNAGLTFKSFHFHYGLKSPYRNPQEDMWVSSIHKININFPF